MNDNTLDAFRYCITDQKCKGCPRADTCFKTPNQMLSIPKLLALDVVNMLVEKDSTLGIKIDANGIKFTSTGDAKQGEERGRFLGKAVMYDTIEKRLRWKGLLTPQIASVLREIHRQYLKEDADERPSEN